MCYLFRKIDVYSNTLIPKETVSGNYTITHHIEVLLLKYTLQRKKKVSSFFLGGLSTKIMIKLESLNDKGQHIKPFVLEV